MHRIPRKSHDVFRRKFRTKAPIILEIGSLVDMSATSAKKNVEEFPQACSRRPSGNTPNAGTDCVELKIQIRLVPR